MATYAIGDLQGCRGAFNALLKKIKFGSQDELWLLGDLINRGEDSLGTLRDVLDIQAQCKIVLGNHDLHFLAIYFGGHSPGGSDTFDDLLAQDDVSELAGWLCRQHMTYQDQELGYFMSHAGLPHIWSMKQARKLGAEVEMVLRDEGEVSRAQFFREMYGNEPDNWQEDLSGMSRVRCITNYLTRMRLVASDGQLDFAHKGALSEAPVGWLPWYELTAKRHYPLKILFGHWAALDGVTGVEDIHALDTGCVWGRQLTAMCLETGERTSVEAK